jgi:hypothetical protein
LEMRMFWGLRSLCKVDGVVVAMIRHMDFLNMMTECFDNCEARSLDEG